MSEKRCTIKDVAKVAGVSTGTISRYLTQKGYVSQQSREKIDAAIKELQYMPNAAARNMVNQKSNLVGIAVPEINNPFLGSLTVKIEACLNKMGYSVMFCNTAFDPVKTEHFVDDLIMRNAEGIILIAADISWTGLNSIRKINKFMAGVSMGQKIPNFDSVNYSEFELGELVADYLITMGHRDIGCISFTENGTQTVQRKNGVISSLKKHQLPIKEQFFVGLNAEMKYIQGENNGYRCAKKLLEGKSHPTAIVAINDYSAIGAYKAVQEKGLRVGEDISIISFDNIEMSQFVFPTLTTVDCDEEELATVTAELLDRRITGKENGSPKDILLTAQIIYRNSVKNIN